MSRMDCRQFELRVDEWLSGTLPDFERGRMEEHAAGCAGCRALADDAAMILGTMRSQALDLPGDAYFADLSERIEQDLTAGGLLMRPTARRMPVGRGRLLSTAQKFALMAACLAILLWGRSAATVLAPEREKEEGPGARDALVLLLELRVPRPSEIRGYFEERERKIVEIYRSSDSS